MKELNLFTLDKKGVVSAAIMGIAVLLLGGNFGPYLLFVLLFFLVLSAIVTEAGKEVKKEIGDYNRPRGWKNVIANGIVATGIAFAIFLNLRLHFSSTNMLIAAYVSSMAAVTADKFASEIGVLDGNPVMLLTLKRVKKGTSGAMSPVGTLASFVGSAIIALSISIIGMQAHYILPIALAGFLGSIIDTILGYFEEHGIGNKYTSNLGCAIAGSVLGPLLLLAL